MAHMTPREPVAPSPGGPGRGSLLAIDIAHQHADGLCVSNDVSHTLECVVGASESKGHFMSNEGYHETLEELSIETRDMHRSVTSLMDSKSILVHNRDEEKEHAAMVLEWIRRRDPRFYKELKSYLFTEKPITEK